MVLNQKNPGRSVTLYSSPILTDAQRTAIVETHKNIFCVLDGTQVSETIMKLLTNNKTTFNDMMVMFNTVFNKPIHILIEHDL